MTDSQYELIKSLPECDGLIRPAQRERLEIEQKRIGFELQLMRLNDSKSSSAAQMADAQSRLASAIADKEKATEGTPEWNDAESRRRRADSDVFDLQLDAAETVEAVKVKVGHQLEVQEAILALKNAHIAKLEARRTVLEQAA